MQHKRQTKRLTQAKFCALIRLKIIILVSITLTITASALAETVYRCGESYSTFAQCPSGPAAEVRASQGAPQTTPSKPSLATDDMRLAEDLEKKRLQAERQATQNTPNRFGAVAPNHPMPPLDAERAPISKPGKHTRQPTGPYFTAKDPTTPAKKKSNAKALPRSN